MKITRTSLASGITRTLDIDITQDQLDRWKGGELIQRVAPYLDGDSREFIISGITSEEWETLFR
jgi:hypothetical protein